MNLQEDEAGAPPHCAAEEVQRHPALRVLADVVVPEDDHPSAWQSGAASFVLTMLHDDRAQDAAPMLECLKALDAAAHQLHGRAVQELEAPLAEALVTTALEQDLLERPTDRHRLRQLSDLLLQGYYGDPGNGGNRDAVSWRMIGYRQEPAGTSWPAQPPAPPPVVGADQVRDAYDVIVVGAGAGGGVTACVLAEGGLSVLLIERGQWLPATALRFDHLRSQRLALGYDTLIDPPAAGHPRVIPTRDGERVLLSTDPRWGNNAQTVGGGTRVYGAQAWRFCPEDFAMASTYGVPDGSTLADWPISYDDLEPDYDWAEWQMGVSGDPAGDTSAGPRRRGYPMPPFSPAAADEHLSQGAEALGLATTAVPMLINTVPYNGRGACIRCASCVGFGCPGEFKTDTRNTVIPRAVATGRCDVLTGTQVARVCTNGAGLVTGVEVVTDEHDPLARRSIAAGDVVLAAGAVETARLLLNSANEREPDGLGNTHDQVGRNLQSHIYAGTWAVFDAPVQDCRGPGPSIATTAHRHHNPGVVGGAMLANDFVPTPLSVYSAGVELGLVAARGRASKEDMRALFPRLLLVMGPVQEVPRADSRVTVEPAVRDRCGLPVARLSGGVHPEDRRTAAFIADRAADWVTASGARSTRAVIHVPDVGPSRGQHQAGTCRMGTDPANSVTDAWGRVWGHENLRIADASLHVTNGGVNPVLTVLALAHRVAERLVAERLPRRTGSEMAPAER